MQQQLSQRCVILLLTCCKTCVHYPCAFAANNRTMLLRSMRKSLDHMQESLQRQFAANIIGVCKLPTTSATSTNLPVTLSPVYDNYYPNFVQPNLSHLNPLTTIYRSIPNEQIYFSDFDIGNYFKQPFDSPFLTSNYLDYLNYNNFYPSLNQLFDYKQSSRAGTLGTNENCKLININSQSWLDNLPNGLPANSLSMNGARQSIYDYLLPSQPLQGELNSSNIYFDKHSLDNHHGIPTTIKYHPPNPFQENGRYFETAITTNKLNSAFLLPRRNHSMITSSSDNNPFQFGDKVQRSSGLTEPYSSANLTDGLGSRSAGSHCCYSPCLPYYASDLYLNNSPINLLHPFNLLSYSNGQNVHAGQQFIHFPNVQRHYLFCQLQALQQQEYQYYDNLYTSAFYNDNDTESNASNKTNQCLTIHNLLASFEVKFKTKQNKKKTNKQTTFLFSFVSLFIIYQVFN